MAVINAPLPSYRTRTSRNGNHKAHINSGILLNGNIDLIRRKEARNNVSVHRDKMQNKLTYTHTKAAKKSELHEC